MLAVLVGVKCKYCERYHCEVSIGAHVRFRCRKCKRLQVVVAGER